MHYGVMGTTRSPSGFAGFFRNTGSTTNPRLGRGIRVLGAGATGAEFPGVNFAGGGEFAGPNGVVGYPTFANGAGVAGFTGTKGNIGVYGVATRDNTFAGLFQNFAPGNATGIRALGPGVTAADLSKFSSESTGGQFAGTHFGIMAVSTNGPAVSAIARGTADALFATGSSFLGGNVIVSGNLDVEGTLSKGSGTFKIDHPLDPANKYLSHSFVESPDMMNIYNGNVVTDGNGKAVVELPDYFEALNRDPRYQLTVIGSPATAYIADKVSGNRFAIKTSEPGVEVSWQITGIRRDAFAVAHPVVVEEGKNVAERGRYLHPEEHGMPASLGIGNALASRGGQSELIQP
jgi:hypothetical protein